MWSQKWLVVAVFLVVVGLWAVPPFAVIDDGSGGARHAALGHHPAWDPPSPAEAEAALGRLVGPPQPGLHPRIRVKRNNVRLGLEILVVAVTAVGLVVLRRRLSASSNHRFRRLP